MTPKALKSAKADELDPSDLHAASASHEIVDEDVYHNIFAHYRPHKFQRAMHALRKRWGKRFLVVVSGRRAGKTYSGAAEFVDHSMCDYMDKSHGVGKWEGKGEQKWENTGGAEPQPFLHYWVVAPTNELLSEPMTQLQKLYGLAEHGGMIMHQDRVQKMWWLRGGIRIDFKSAHIPERLVSRGLHGLWMDEAARVHPDAWLEHAQPALADHEGWGLFTTTPLGKNWVWSNLWCLADPGENDQLDGVALNEQYAAIRWTTMDNTAIPGLRDEANRQRGTMPEPLWRRNFLAQFTAFKGQVFMTINPDDHLLQNVAYSRGALEQVVAGFDYGWRHNGVFTVLGRTYDGVWIELETVSKKSTPLITPDVVKDRLDNSWAAIGMRLFRKWRFTRLFLNANQPEPVEMFRYVGLPVMAAHTDRLSRLQWAQVAIHNKDLKFCSPHVFRCFESLRHPDNPMGLDSELWIKERDDEFDGVTYALSDDISRGRVQAMEGVQHCNILRMR